MIAFNHMVPDVLTLPLATQLIKVFVETVAIDVMQNISQVKCTMKNQLW
jgi:hypothetical protein